MKTSELSQSTTQHAHREMTHAGLLHWFNEQADRFEQARFFWMAVYITAQSCLGSIACMFILKNDASVFMLCTCAAMTMMTNAVLIAQASARLCLLVVYLSFLVNTVFLVINV